MATAGSTAAAAIANAIKASGVLVRVEPNEFTAILARSECPLVVTADKSFMSGGFKYLTSYKGLAFFTKSPEQLHFPGTVEIITAKSIWIPG